MQKKNKPIDKDIVNFLWYYVLFGLYGILVSILSLVSTYSKKIVPFSVGGIIILSFVFAVLVNNETAYKELEYNISSIAKEIYDLEHRRSTGNEN